MEWFMRWVKPKTCCCEALRKEMKQRFDTIDYGMIRILNSFNEIQRQNPYAVKPWRVNFSDDSNSDGIKL